MKNTHIYFTISLSLSVVACGGGGASSTPDTSPPPPDDSQLSITIGGLPLDQTGSVVIDGPNGFNQTVQQSTDLTGLAAGTYSISVADVDVSGVTFESLPAEQSITLTQGGTESLSILYQSDVVSTGVITNFGSVYVNGIRFDTAQAAVSTDDNDNANEDDLAVGMVVTVRGRATASGDVASATSVDYRVKAEGPVEQISLSDGTINVLGQLFYVDELTIFEGTTFETIMLNDVVEISATSSEEGSFVATRIELEDDQSAEFKARGSITSLDIDASTFSLGNTIVDYSAAVVDGELANDAEVLVTTSQALVDGVLIADTVEVKNDDEDANGQQIALDGVITEILSEQQFVVAGQTIAWSETTEFEGGDSEELAVGLRIKAFGSLVDNVLQSRKIRLDKEGVIKVEGPIEAIDLDNEQITVLNTTFSFDSHSKFVDKSEARVRRMTLAELALGDVVDVKAFQSGDALIVRLLKREDMDEQDGEVEISGIVTDFSEPNITLQGVSVTTSDLTEFELPDTDVDAATFFAMLAAGDKIEVSGQYQADGSVLATEVELLVDDSSDDDDSREGRVKFEGLITEVISATEFIVNGRNITTDSRTQFEDGNASDLSVDVQVEIKGWEASDGSILAEKIEFEREDGKEELELKGVIENFNSATDFTVNGQAVTTTEGTEYDDGDVSQLADSVIVEIEGYLNADSVLVADEIEFEEAPEREREVKGTISGFVSVTEFMVDGQAITTDEQTRFKNGNSTLLADGIEVEIEGYLNTDDVLVAEKVEFEEPEESEVNGIIDAVVSDTQFTVNGITVIHNEFTRFKKGDASDIAVDAEVEVEGYLDASGALIAEKIEFED